MQSMHEHLPIWEMFMQGGGVVQEGLYLSPHDCLPLCPIGPQVVPDFPDEAAQSQLIPVGISHYGGTLVYKRPVILHDTCVLWEGPRTWVQY